MTNKPQCCFEQIENAVKCVVCGRVVQTHYPPEKVHANCGKGYPNLQLDGPGKDLHDILEKIFGIKLTFGCGCSNWIRAMNTNGLSWCISNKSAISRKLLNEAKKRKYNKLISNSLMINTLLNVSFAYSKGKLTYKQVTALLGPLSS